MASSLHGKLESEAPLASEQDAVVHPAGAPPSDASATMISKHNPEFDISESPRKESTPESVLAGLRGRRLAHFELIEPIGIGGMAAVFRAHDTLLDRQVALKILPPDMAQEPDNVQRLHQEARAAAKLDHENIARVFYCGADQGLHFIAFEFVEGINVRAILEQRRRLPVAEAVRYIMQVATGLEHAATRGVVHRDVKPSNIIVSPTGQAKLVDMGLARSLERHERDLTQSGVTMGTFDYISPEQALEPREADTRSDIYSLGCTFYHMLTGHAPTPEGTAAKKLNHHHNLAPIDPRDFDATIPEEIVIILGKMMAKNRADRYQRPIHLVHDLTQIAAKLGIADGVRETAAFAGAPFPNESRSRPVLIVSLALGVLVAVTLLGNWLSPDEPANLVPVRLSKSRSQPKMGGGNPGLAKPNGIVTPRDKAASLDDLKHILNDPSKIAKAEIVAPKIDLEGHVFKGKRLELFADDVESNVLRFTYQDKNFPVGLSVEGCEEVVFRGLKFEVSSATSNNQAVAAVAVRGAKYVRFEKCVFPQRTPKLSAKHMPIASVLIDSPEGIEGSKPDIYFDSCRFDGGGPAGGQAAIAINGPANDGNRRL